MKEQVAKRLEHLSKAELRLYSIGPCRTRGVGQTLEFADLVAIDGDFDVSVTVFNRAEIDLAIQRQVERADPTDLKRQ